MTVGLYSLRARSIYLCVEGSEVADEPLAVVLCMAELSAELS